MNLLLKRKMFIIFFLKFNLPICEKTISAAEEAEHLPLVPIRCSPMALKIMEQQLERMPTLRKGIVQASTLPCEEKKPPTDLLHLPTKPEVTDREDVASMSDFSSSRSSCEGGSLAERSISLLMQKLGITPPETAQDDSEAASRAIIRNAYKTVIAAYFGMLDSLHEAIAITDLQTSVLIYCNTSMQPIFGRLKKDLAFRRITDFFALNDEEKAQTMESIQAILHHGQSQQLATGERANFKHTSNITGLYYDGITEQPVPLEYTVSLLKLEESLACAVSDCALATFVFRHYDPLYQVALNARIAESVFANCPLAIVQADFFGTIKNINRATGIMFNVAVEPTIGRNVSIFMPEQLRASHDRFLEAFRCKIAARPNYSSKIINNDRSFNSRILTTKTWDGRELRITLDVKVIDGVLIAYIRDCEAMVLGEEYRRAQIKNSFPRLLSEKYFAGKVPSSKEGLKIGVKKKAIMRIDLANSTEKFSDCSADEHYGIINAFLSELDKIIAQFQGVTIKHTGDGSLAIFDPIYKEQDFAKFALLCGISCLAKSKELSKSPPIPSKPSWGDFFSIRIGIGIGDFITAIVGTSEHLTDVDVIGNAVNIASRLEAATLANTVAIDLETYQLAKIATTKIGLKDLCTVVTLDAPLKGTTLSSFYRLGIDRLSPHAMERINAKGLVIAEEASGYLERLKSLRRRHL